MHSGHEPAVHVVCALDLAEIDAVGFDLDHTLAVYDDAGVNALAYDETCEFLTDAGFPAARLGAPYDESAVCRGLLLDTETGAAVKADAVGRVRRALSDGAWLSAADIDRAYAAPVDGSARFHAIHSPFDLPTAFFFQLLSHTNNDFAGTCRSIRHHLDRAHTRGRLKQRILSDVERMVHPLASGTAPFERLREAGKRLFVLTNSETDYSEALLDRLFGDRWRTLFDVVATGARKPSFFGVASPIGAAADQVVDGANAPWLESSLGVAPHRVLYVGDSVKSDTLPARRHGWRTAHVVQELGERGTDAWGGALFEDGQPTWFAAMIAAHADIYAATVRDVLEPGPTARFVPAQHPFSTMPRRD